MQFLALDIESIGLDPYEGTIWSITITEFIRGKPKTTIYEDCYGLKKIPVDIIKKLQDKNICKIIHNGDFDGTYIELNLGIRIVNIWDTQKIEVVIVGRRVTKDDPEPLQKKYGTKLQYMLPRYGMPKPKKERREVFIDRPVGVPFVKADKEYMIDDVKYLPAIQQAQLFLLKRDKLLEVGELENKMVEKVTSMRVHGIGFDQKLWRKIALDNAKERDKRFAQLPKGVSNWNSHDQVKDFFKDMGIFIPSYKEIYKIYLKTRNKTLAQFIWAKELNKSVTTYGLTWFANDEGPGYIDPDGRIRCDVDQIVDTGRMSISKPPLQQMPGVDIKNQQKLRAMRLIMEQLKISHRQVPQHRRAFIPGPGKVFVKGDFGGQEMGIMAAASGEELWIEAMLRGEDIHALTASLLYQREWAEGRERGCKFPFKCTCKKHRELREPTKILNFMLAYGGGPQKFADDTGIEMLDATVIVARYKRIIPTLTRWLEKNGMQALNTGVSFSADPYRRRRVLHGEEAWQIRNQGKNTPIQAAGANMLKLAMISIPDKYYMPLIIHDEIILEVNKREGNTAAKVLKKVMEDSADYITGIKGLVKVKPVISKSLMKDE